MILLTTKQRLHRIERSLASLHYKIDSLLRSQNLEILMEYSQMADFTVLAADVAKIKGTVASTKVFIQGLKARIEELAAGVSDTADQAAIMALAADLGATETALADAIVTDPVGSAG
jgi:hypothetical protein